MSSYLTFYWVFFQNISNLQLCMCKLQPVVLLYVYLEYSWECGVLAFLHLASCKRWCYGYQFTDDKVPHQLIEMTDIVWSPLFVQSSQCEQALLPLEESSQGKEWSTYTFQKLAFIGRTFLMVILIQLIILCTICLSSNYKAQLTNSTWTG